MQHGSYSVYRNHCASIGSVASGSGSSILSATNSEHSHRLDTTVRL